jgi:hypothetical protein
VELLFQELAWDLVFEVLLDVPVLEAQEAQQVRIAEDQVRRELVVGAKRIQLRADPTPGRAAGARAFRRAAPADRRA